ncbi:MAG: glycosyltransferase family 2 protein [Lachnospiraceae bacterium]
MKSDIYFSIVMATYNSEDTIEKALTSIRNQDFNQNQIEILVVDGGSTDRTREIAEKYDCIILDNPERLPEPAKVIGLKAAKGKFLCIMDSDEELFSKDQFSKRQKLLEGRSELKCLAIGLITPQKSDPCCYYINMVGDPFSCFVYQTFKDSMEGLIIRKGEYLAEYDSYVAQYSKGDIKPIGDSGTVMDLQYIREHYEDILDELTTSTIFDKVITDTGSVGYVNNDRHFHYTSSSFSVIFKKLKFRIINNIFNISGSGYARKAEDNKRLNRRKFYFPLYACSIVLPIIDGFRLAINYRHWVFLLHPIFTWYVVVEIICQLMLKMLGKTAANTSYAK